LRVFCIGGVLSLEIAKEMEMTDDVVVEQKVRFSEVLITLIWLGSTISLQDKCSLTHF